MKHTPTQINFEYEGQKFCLEFTADSLKEAEKKYGLKLGNLGENLTTANEDLFCAPGMSYQTKPWQLGIRKRSL